MRVSASLSAASSDLSSDESPFEKTHFGSIVVTWKITRTLHCFSPCFLLAIMLNPPLSLLSDDLLVSIVEHVAKLPSKDEDLYNLSLADRAFTHSCQKYIFRNLKFSSERKISKNIIKAKKILDKNPSFANQVRMVELLISRKASWVFKDHAFISILQLLSKSLMPPHELHFGGHTPNLTVMKDPIIVVRQLAKSSFSQTLTILRLTNFANVPLPLFLICPRLREVFLNHVGATETSYHSYPDDQCCGR